MKLIKEKNQQFIIWNKKADASAYNPYKIIKTVANRQLKKTGDEYTKKTFESLPDLKQQRKFVNSKLKQKRSLPNFLKK